MKLNAKKTALCGCISGAAFFVLWLSSIFHTMKFSSAAIAGLLLCAVVMTAGKKAAWLSFFATTLLSLILLPNKDAAIYFAVFLGYYPILKSKMECQKSRAAEYAGKFCSFNAAFFLLCFFIRRYGVSGFLDGIPLWRIAAFANIVFILYDIGLSRYIALLSRLIEKIR